MRHSFFFTVIFLLCVAPVYSQQLSAKEVIKKAEDKTRGVKSSKSSMTISTVRPKWTRDMTLKSWSLGNDFSLSLITSPSKDKGITFLKRKKEIWNWVPSIERTIKLPPSMMSQSWMGTDLTNDDMVRESSNVTDYKHKFLADRAIDGNKCYQIEMIPKEDAPVIWEKVIVFVDKNNFVQRRAEMYDEDLELVTLIKSSAIKKMGNKEIATKMEYIPMDKKGHKTVMTINSIVFDEPMNEDFFTIQNMKRIK